MSNCTISLQRHTAQLPTCKEKGQRCFGESSALKVSMTSSFNFGGDYNFLVRVEITSLVSMNILVIGCGFSKVPVSEWYPGAVRKGYLVGSTYFWYHQSPPVPSLFFPQKLGTMNLLLFWIAFYKALCFVNRPLNSVWRYVVVSLLRV